MPICSSGISREKAGLATSIVVDQAYVQHLLPAGLAWIYPYLPWMHGLEIGDVGAFCAIDPPTWTVPTGPQIFDFITGGNFANANLVQQFIQDVTRAYLWYNLCECASVTTPAAPTAPTAPSNLPAVNPPTVVQPNTAQPCLVRPFHGQNVAGFIVDTGFIPLPSSSGMSVFLHGIANPPPTAGFHDYGLTPTWWTLVPFAVVRGDARQIVSYLGGTVQTLAPPAGATHLSISMDQPGPPYNFGSLFDLDVTVYCNGDLPTGVASPCCPPDPILHATLLQILQLATLMQRNLAPFAYVAGASHAGLTGNGALTIPSCLGVRVTLTTIPTWVGVEAGDPTEYFEAGWLSWGDSTGFAAREFLSHNPQLSFPAEAARYTRIGYTLAPGVVATIQELYAES